MKRAAARRNVAGIDDDDLRDAERARPREDDWARAWAEEIDRRLAALKNGTEKRLDLATVLEELRNRHR